MELSSFTIGIGFSAAKTFSDKIVTDAIIDAALQGLKQKIVNPLKPQKQTINLPALFKKLKEENLELHSIGALVFTNKENRKKTALVHKTVCKKFKIKPKKLYIKTEKIKGKEEARCFAFISLKK
jgi:2C-methyl-D-erythritol 2,4-cyclodiphosphate synthase